MTHKLSKQLVESCVISGCVREEDVKILRRDLLADGVWTREEAADLIALERGAHDRCEAWNRYFVETLTDFVVWNSRPTGHVEAETAAWLIDQLISPGEKPRGNARDLLVAIVREADTVDPRLAEAAYGVPPGGASRAAMTLSLGWLDAAGISA